MRTTSHSSHSTSSTSCFQRIQQFLDFKESFVDKLNVVFGKWALIVYDYPYTVIIVTLILAAIPIIGFIPGIAQWKDGADVLYSLPVSDARNDGIIRDLMFAGSISRAEFLVVTAKEEGRNLMTWNILEQIRQLDEIAQGKRVDPVGGHLVALPANEMYYPEWFDDPTNAAQKPDKSMLTYRDICAVDPVAGCKVQSIFEMGIDDIRLMNPQGAAPEIWVIDGLVFASNKKGFSPDFVLGSPTYVPCRREMPTALISLILSPDRYLNSTKPGSSVVDVLCVTEVKALNFVYELDDSVKFQPRELAWEYVFYETMKRNERFLDLKVGAMAFRSRDDELSKSTTESEDVIFVVYTFILLIAYTTFVNFNLDQYRNKTISSVAGSIACLLGLYAGLGVPSMWGTAFVPTSLVCPFIVMGVGADDIFVVIGSYVLAYGEDSPRQRCAVCLRGCGVSVVMTTVTNVIAFAIGIQSPYLSIKNFCIFTLFGLTFSLMFELSLFFAFVCIEARKEEAKQACICGIPKDENADKEPFNITKVVSTYQVVYVLVERQLSHRQEFQVILDGEGVDQAESWIGRKWRSFCNRGSVWYMPAEGDGAQPRPTPSTVSLEDEIPSDLQSSDDSSSSKVSAEIAALASDPSWAPFLTKHVPFDRYKLHPKLEHPAYQSEPKGAVGTSWRNVFIQYYCPILLKPWMKVLVLLLFMVNLGVSIYGFTRLNQGLEMVDLSPDGSYLKTYDYLTATYLNKVDLPVEVFFVGEIPFHERRVVETIAHFVDRVNGRVENTYLNDPLTRMYSDLNLSPSLQSENRTEFNRALKLALEDPASPYKQFERDFVWKGDTLVSYRLQLLPAGTTSSEERAHWMLTMRADCDWARDRPVSDTQYPLDVRFYNYMLVFYESDIVIMKSVISSLTTASIALLVVTLLLIPDLSSGAIVILIMLLIDLAVIGYMAFWEVNLNMISMVILVISIGFAVDYSAHICYAFVNAIGPNRNIRTVESIVLIGTPLFHGATSNFLGIVLLGASTSYIFRVFFKMMTLVVLQGIAHGLILLPVILSLVGKCTAAVPVDRANVLEAINKGVSKPYTITATQKILKAEDMEEGLSLLSASSQGREVNPGGGGGKAVSWFVDGDQKNMEDGRQLEIEPTGHTPIPRRKNLHRFEDSS